MADERKLPDDDPYREGRADLWELGIRTAFGADPEADTPLSSSVLESLLRAGRAEQIRLPRFESEDTLAPEPTEIDVHSQGRYRVVSELARGGVGSVLKAWDVDLRRDVALKVLLDSHRDNDEMTMRFLAEAQIGGQLEHPGIVPVHEIGLLGDARPYFAMKLVKGQTLAELLRARTHPTDGRSRFLSVFAQLCQTLAYAHARGVVHRDLKPANIMVGSFGEVQVMDWGLAKVMPHGRVDPPSGAAAANSSSPHDDHDDHDRVSEAMASASASDSLAGTVMGTPSYMSPEQARGEVERLDERTDVFGLGAILCEILTGFPPFSGGETEEVCRQAQSGDVSLARQRLQSCSADGELIALAVACLHPRFEERPRDARVVAERVANYLESVERRVRESQLRAARAKTRLLLTLLALTVVVCGAVGFFIVDRVREARREEVASVVIDSMSRAQELRAQAKSSGDASLWDAALREARRALDLAGPDSTVQEGATELWRELQGQARDQQTLQALERLREERDSDAEALEYRLKEIFSICGIDLDHDEPEIIASKVRDSAVRTELVFALDQWAIMNRLRRARSRALQIAQKADNDPWRNELRQALQDNDRDRLRGLARRATEKVLAPSTLEVLAFALRDKQLKRDVWTRAQQLYPSDFWINLRLGDSLRHDGLHAEALQFLRAAVALRPSSAYAVYKLGSGLMDKGDIQEAVRNLGTAISLDARLAPSYYKCVKILTENNELISRAAISRLLEVVQQIASTRRGFHEDGLILLQAQLLFLAEKQREAILALERSLRLRPSSWQVTNAPWHHGAPSRKSLLAQFRSAVRPDLVSFASIDAVLEPVKAGATLPETLDQFRRLCEAREGPHHRLSYLEGRLHQLNGEYAKATSILAEVARHNLDFPEPAVRLSECLRASGDVAGAQATLRAAIGRPANQFPDVWNAWLRITLVDLDLTAEQVLRAFPAAGSPGQGGNEYVEELRWLFRRLAAGQPIRINCGGKDHVDADGNTWVGDRFFSPGGHHFFSPGGYRFSRRPGTADPDPRLGTWRWFPNHARSAGYRIPLPKGHYVVEIEHATSRQAWGPRRRLSVVIESDVLKNTDRRFQHSVHVDDGFLDIRLRRSRGAPNIAAISVESVPSAP